MRIFHFLPKISTIKQEKLHNNINLLAMRQQIKQVYECPSLVYNLIKRFVAKWNIHVAGLLQLVNCYQRLKHQRKMSNGNVE